MSGSSIAGTLQECADEVNDFIGTLERYPDTVLAFVLRAHLVGLLQAMVQHDRWSGDEVSTFLEELTRQTLET